MLMSHRSPVNPTAQVQVKSWDGGLVLQVPPFWHGVDEHASYTCKTKYNTNLYNFLHLFYAIILSIPLCFFRYHTHFTMQCIECFATLYQWTFLVNKLNYFNMVIIYDCGNSLNGRLTSSQFLPIQSTPQSQRYSSMKSWQVPELLHGFGSQSSMLTSQLTPKNMETPRYCYNFWTIVSFPRFPISQIKSILQHMKIKFPFLIDKNNVITVPSSLGLYCCGTNTKCTHCWKKYRNHCGRRCSELCCY